MRALCLVLCIAALSLSTARAATITGRVVGPDDKPVAHAEVIINLRYVTEELLTVRTDKSGEFSVDVEVPKQRQQFAGRIFVCTPGLAFGGGGLKKEGNVIRLEPAGQAWGSVTDEKGKPVAGAILTLHGVPDSIRDRFAVKTTADGRWTMPNVPTSGKALVVLDDPRYAHATTEAELGPHGAPARALIARPAATITGRVVREGGAPAAGIRVFAQGVGMTEGWSSDITSADGSYRLASLPAGTFNVMVDEPSGKWVAAAATEVDIQEGETLSLPDLVMIVGGIVQGTVADDATGEMLAGTWIGSYGPHRPRSSAAIIGTTTDEQGRYRLRVAPGKSYIYVSGPPPGYLRPERGTDVAVGKGEVKTVDFRLTKGLSVSGIALDLEARPAAGARIALSVESSVCAPAGSGVACSDTAHVREDGKFIISALLPGKGRFVAGGDWEIVEPQYVELPAPEPVKVILRRVEVLTLTGRVVSPNAEPIAAATVNVIVTPQQGLEAGIGRRHELMTDAEGRFWVAGLRPDAQAAISAKKQDHKYVSGGVVVKRDGAFNVSDIVLAPLVARIEGRVVATSGAPVAGVKVMSPDGDPNARAVTGRAGEFVLDSLPQGEVELLAAHDRSFGAARAQPGGAPVLITLSPVRQPPGRDLARGYAILEHVGKESEGSAYYARYGLYLELAPYGPDLALKFAVAPDGTPSDAHLRHTILRLGQVDPALAVQWAPQRLNQIHDPAVKAQTTARLGLAVFPLRPDLAAQLYRKAVEESDRAQLAAAGRTPDVFARAPLAALAGRLKHPAAEGLLDEVIAAAQERVSREGDRDPSLVEQVIAGVAALSPELAERAMARSQLSGRERASIVSSVIQEISRRDTTVAQRMLSTLQGSGEDETGFYFGLAAKSLVEELGRADPQRALAVARKVQHHDHRAIALALAAQYQQKELAAQVFREAARESSANPGRIAWIAAIAHEIDPELGAELFAAARKSIVTDNAADRTPGRSLAMFSFYYSRIDPAESRLMLELEFARSLRAGAELGGRYFSLVPPILAIAAVDVDRALEMARSIPDEEPNAKFDAMRKIAQYALASEAVRRTMPFDRWTASDTWVPGTPTGW